MADSWNEQQYGYNAQSETTDFTTNSDSSVTTKPLALTKAAEENVVESPQALLFGDDQFHLLAEQIMAEHQSPRAQRMQSGAAPGAAVVSALEIGGGEEYLERAVVDQFLFA